MTFAELLRHPPFRLAMSGFLLLAALLVGSIIWWHKVGRQRVANYNETQKAHVEFRKKFTVPYVLGIFLMPWLTMRLPSISLPNGEALPLQFLACMGFPLLMGFVIYIAGRVKFGKEGSLKHIPQEENQ